MEFNDLDICPACGHYPTSHKEPFGCSFNIGDERGWEYEFCSCMLTDVDLAIVIKALQEAKP